jgi:hypothetical protein
VLIVKNGIILIAHRISFAFSSAGLNNKTTKEHPDTTKESLLEDESSVEQDSLQSNSEEDNKDDSEEEDGNEDITEELQEEMATMSVKAKAMIKLPMLMYTWSKNRQEHCSVDILLLSGTTEDQIQCKINKSGRHMTIFYKLPEYFFSSRRLEASSKGQIDQNHSKTSALNKALMNFVRLLTLRIPFSSSSSSFLLRLITSFFVRLHGTNMTTRRSMKRNNSITICYT